MGLNTKQKERQEDARVTEGMLVVFLFVFVCYGFVSNQPGHCQRDCPMGSKKGKETPAASKGDPGAPPAQARLHRPGRRAVHNLVRSMMAE